MNSVILNHLGIPFFQDDLAFKCFQKDEVVDSGAFDYDWQAVNGPATGISEAEVKMSILKSCSIVT